MLLLFFLFSLPFLFSLFSFTGYPNGQLTLTQTHFPPTPKTAARTVRAGSKAKNKKRKKKKKDARPPVFPPVCFFEFAQK